MRAHEFIKENEIVTETPLPDGSDGKEAWDKSVFTPQTSYKKRIEYAVARAQKIGKGSSRSAFEIEYQGRPTILKVAHNKKGAAQNQAEAAILDDGYIKQIGIAIPLIDYDEDHDEPTWIHTEKALKATPKTLCNLMKTPSLDTLVDHATYSLMGDFKTTNRIKDFISQKFSEADVETFFEYSDMLMELSNSFDINISDFRRAANWGIYNGQPIIIDLGFTEEVKKKHY
jgi:hypothetical protein